MFTWCWRRFIFRWYSHIVDALCDRKRVNTHNIHYEFSIRMGFVIAVHCALCSYVTLEVNEWKWMSCNKNIIFSLKSYLYDSQRRILCFKRHKICIFGGNLNIRHFLSLPLTSWSLLMGLSSLPIFPPEPSLFVPTIMCFPSFMMMNS